MTAPQTSAVAANGPASPRRTTRTTDATAPETSAVTWGGRRLPYTIRRSSRRKKTVAVTVDPGGRIVVVAPVPVATTRLDAIVTRKAAWIVQRLRRAEGHGPTPSPREFVRRARHDPA